MSVCVCERERECVCVRVSERECVCVKKGKGKKIGKKNFKPFLSIYIILYTKP